jgi:hypothetical protein
MAALCSFLSLSLPGRLFGYFVNYFEVVPVAPAVTSITFALKFHTCCISTVRFSYIILCWSRLCPLQVVATINIRGTCYFFSIADHDVRFIVRNSSVGSHLLVPLYGNLTSMTCFDWFWYMVRCLLSNFYSKHKLLLLLLLLLLLFRIYRFSGLAGKYSPILGFSNQQD